MQHVVLATAGHIDHGKTELTRALTGINTDRLPEEKARGITIDLGFAHMELMGRRVAFIDVPGHERFVRNMLAGVGGIDLALLIVAADESVMPQTREHLAILQLLAVPRGVIALTKRDLVDEDMLELVRLEVADLVRGSVFEQSPVVAVSARTGAGIDDLRRALDGVIGAIPARPADGPFRLHVDRAFSVRGFGSVVTGTVWSGQTRVGDALAGHPGALAAKVRGIEVHGHEVEAVAAGSRAALNLAGVDLEAIERGCQLVTPETFAPASLIDVRLRLLADATPLKDLARVHLHLGASEVLARVKLLGGEERRLAPGGEVFAQLRCERPLLAWPGDRFIIRSYSPLATIGGGSVVDLPTAKHRGEAKDAVVLLERLVAADLTARVDALVDAAGERGVSVADLVRRTGRPPTEIEQSAKRCKGLVRIPGQPARLFAASAWQDLEGRALALLREFHAREPLREGMSREELHGRLFRGDPASAKRLLEGLAASGRARLLEDRIAHADHRVRLSVDEERDKLKLEQLILTAGLAPPSTKEALATIGPDGDDVLRLLVRAGRLVMTPGGFHYHVEVLGALKERLRAELGAGGELTVTQFKDLTGTSRKHAIPLLEYLDGSRFTRRRGDVRIIVG